MAIWYLNMIEENKILIDIQGMKVFQYITSKHLSYMEKTIEKQMLV